MARTYRSRAARAYRMPMRPVDWALAVAIALPLTLVAAAVVLPLVFG